MAKEFEGQVVFITGAAGFLGQAVTRAFAERGAKLALADRGDDRLKELYGDLPDTLYLGGADVTDLDKLTEAVDETIKKWGQIDVLVNLAGTWRGGTPVHETPVETWDFLVGLNAKSVFLTAHAVVPHMLEKGSGKIVSVAAKAAYEGRAKNAVQAVSKAAILRLTESMSAELKNEGINVNCVVPSTMDNPVNREQMPDADFSKWVKPEEVAEAIVFLASERASGVYGAALTVFGRTTSG